MVPLPDLEYYVPELFDVFRANDDDSDFIPSTATSGTTNRDTESVGNVEVESEEEDITSNELVVQEIQEGYLAGENSGIDVESDPEDQRMEEILKELQSRDWYKNANLVKFFLTHTQDKKVPKNQKEAYASVDREKWIAAEKDEMESIKEMDVYDKILDHCPANVKAIGSRWVYAINPATPLLKLSFKLMLKMNNPSPHNFHFFSV